MIKLITSLSLCLMLSGCFGTTVKVTDTQTVKEAIAVRCKPSIKITEIVEYPTDKIRSDMSLYEKSQLIIAERDLLKGQNKELKAGLKECTESE